VSVSLFWRFHIRRLWCLSVRCGVCEWDWLVNLRTDTSQFALGFLGIRLIDFIRCFVSDSRNIGGVLGTRLSKGACLIFMATSLEEIRRMGLISILFGWSLACFSRGRHISFGSELLIVSLLTCLGRARSGRGNGAFSAIDTASCFLSGRIHWS
jgi:hypothetical protein